MSKYNAKKVIYQGITFASIKEAQRYYELRLLERAGEIQNLRLQVNYLLIPTQKRDDGKTERRCKYKADFVYTENGQEVVEDAKGVRTKDYIIKRKLMLYVHGISVKEV